MAYLIGLFLVLAIVFSVASGSDLVGNLKHKITETIFPKSQTEITVENLKNDYETLGDFFSNSVPAILSSKDVSAQDKAVLKKAVAAFSNSKNLVGDLEQLTKEDEGILEAAIEKILGLDEKHPPAGGLEPTSIPPQCKLVCGE